MNSQGNPLVSVVDADVGCEKALLFSFLLSGISLEG